MVTHAGSTAADSAAVLRHKLPCRLGCTSYLIPADIIPNVRRVASLVDDVELTLFESPDRADLPDKDAIHELATLQREHALTYTLHLPIDRKAGSADRRERQAFSDHARRIIDHFARLCPFAYILHLDGIDKSAPASVRQSWARRVSEVCEGLVEHLNCDTERVAVETLAYDPLWHFDLVSRYGLSHCLDIGHIRLHHHARRAALSELLMPHTRVIHLHGVHEGKDHRPLSHADADDLRALGRLVKETSFQGVLTLELFSEQALFHSLPFLERTWDELF